MSLLSPKTNVCRFLDPFGGGGAFALEAARAGFDVVTNDNVLLAVDLPASIPKMRFFSFE